MTEFKSKIGLICAMEVELDGIKKLMTIEREEKISGINFVLGTLCGVKTAAAICGVGKVFAAICAEAMILNYSPDIIINSGVAGGLSKTLSICDAAIAESAVEHDMDTSPLGDPVGLISGINIINIPCDKKASRILIDAAENLGIHTEYGTIASGDKFISSDKDREFIKDEFSAIACEMEGAAIAHVCYVNNVKCAVLRTISDGGDDNAKMDFPVFVKKASENLTKIIQKFAGEYK